MELPAYPYFKTTIMTEDQALLGRLEDDFVASVAGEPEVERFLFGAVPVRVFDQIFATGSSAAAWPGLLWLMHLSGYFGGQWLRGEIAEAQPDALLVAFSQPPSKDQFHETMEKAQVALDAAQAPDKDALAYAATSLRQQPPRQEGGEEESGLTDLFGYNLGYLLEILAAPPAGVNANPRYQIKSDGLFGCEYVTPRLAVLTELAELQDVIVAGAQPYEDLVAELLPIQDNAIPRGRSVWSGGLSVQGFSQGAYDQLLDVSSSFLETAQATALTMCQAEIEADPKQARSGALANAAMITWLDAYLVGITDGEGDTALPEFAAR